MNTEVNKNIDKSTAVPNSTINNQFSHKCGCVDKKHHSHTFGELVSARTDKEEVHYFSNLLHPLFNPDSLESQDTESDDSNQIAEVIFNNKRKQLYKNENNLDLKPAEMVIVEVESGIEIGAISAIGKIAINKLHNHYHNFNPENKIIRHATGDDIETYLTNKENETGLIDRSREFIVQHNLDMKITGAEWQFDHQRLTIYFTAPGRIDFRGLVKDLAKFFRTRIELRQINNREEAKRIGGMGACGRDICCSTMDCYNHFITLEHAQLQQLSTNLGKLCGYCGRLKCCLMFEYDTYAEELKDYPPINSILYLPDGKAKLVKADIFKQLFFAVMHETHVFRSLTFTEVAQLKEQGKVDYPATDEKKHSDYSDRIAEEAESLEYSY